jgi:hypothetical protein
MRKNDVNRLHVGISAASQQDYYIGMVDAVISLLHSQIIIRGHVQRAGSDFPASGAAHFVASKGGCQYLSAKRKAVGQIWYTKYSMRHLTSQAVWEHIYCTAQMNLSYRSR